MGSMAPSVAGRSGSPPDPIRRPDLAGWDFTALSRIEYLGWANHDRLHEALGDLPPAEFEQLHGRRTPPKPSIRTPRRSKSTLPGPPQNASQRVNPTASTCAHGSACTRAQTVAVISAWAGSPRRGAARASRAPSPAAA